MSSGVVDRIRRLHDFNGISHCPHASRVSNNHITYPALTEFHSSQICIALLSKQLQWVQFRQSAWSTLSRPKLSKPNFDALAPNLKHLCIGLVSIIASPIGLREEWADSIIFIHSERIYTGHYMWKLLRARTNESRVHRVVVISSRRIANSLHTIAVFHIKTITPRFAGMIRGREMKV